MWRAAPILISGAEAYRDHEFLYQGFLYDDHGAHQQLDPSDPRISTATFSQPNGTYTYPANPAYANNAADLVEFRVRPLVGATAFSNSYVQVPDNLAEEAGSRSVSLWFNSPATAGVPHRASRAINSRASTISASV